MRKYVIYIDMLWVSCTEVVHQESQTKSTETLISWILLDHGPARNHTYRHSEVALGGHGRSKWHGRDTSVTFKGVLEYCDGPSPRDLFCRYRGISGNIFTTGLGRTPLWDEPDVVTSHHLIWNMFSIYAWFHMVSHLENQSRCLRSLWLPRLMERRLIVVEVFCLKNHFHLGKRLFYNKLKVWHLGLWRSTRTETEPPKWIKVG